MKVTFLVGSLLGLVSLSLFAAEPPDFSGTWEFNAEKSKNVGMMSQMKMTATVQQTATAVDITTHSNFMGKDSEGKTHFDLTGAPTTNDAPMGGPNETISKWDGNKLVTTWKGQSAVAGQTVVRTETRSVTADGREMIVESVRGSTPALVMVYEKKS
ncbi:MAG: hypothetical protein H0X40_17360 [Chthoniobacterales bacterium]|nr:hypothetical protein [Chthoniobacterales bacterium]